MEKIESMERLLHGDEATKEERDEEDWLELLHEEMMNLETEAEWESFVNRFIK
jgi:hypothetical protein